MVEEKKEKIEWQKCPKCGRFIPKTWDHDQKCGWNIPTDEKEAVEQKTIEENKSQEIVDVRTIVINEVLDLHTKLKENLEKRWGITVKEYPELIQAINTEFIQAVGLLKK